MCYMAEAVPRMLTLERVAVALWFADRLQKLAKERYFRRVFVRSGRRVMRGHVIQAGVAAGAWR